MRPVTDLKRRVAPFEVISDYQPSGDQPTAIEDIEKRVRGGEEDVVLLGATGTGKTATVAWAVERLQRPTLVMQPNKTLAAQLYAEFKEPLYAPPRQRAAHTCCFCRLPTRRNCWLAPLRSGNWLTSAPLAVDRCQTSTTLFECRLRSR